MNREQTSIVRRLRHLVADAKAAGLFLAADADQCAVRVMLASEERGAEDLRTIGITVDLHGGCGSGIIPRINGSGHG